MKLIDFFGSYIKPYRLKGNRMLNPAPTGKIEEGLSCIKEHDVNIWFFKKGETTIAIDSGYKNFEGIDEHFSKIGIEAEKVSAVFMTHVDIDHAGGIDKDSKIVFPRADVYLGENEEVHLTNQFYRFKLAFIKIYNTIRFNEGYRLLKDEDSVQIGDIKIRIISTPGHTKGHTCYLIDDEILFTGDCLAVNKSGGYCFFNFFNVDTELNMESLKHLKKTVENKKLRVICTGHSGFTYDVARSFDHIHQIAESGKKHPFDLDAPYDVYAD